MPPPPKNYPVCACQSFNEMELDILWLLANPSYNKGLVFFALYLISFPFIRSSDDNCALQETLGSNTPIYENPRKGNCAIKLLSILLGKTSASHLCTKKPCGVRTFASFIIDLNSVCLKDLHADDNGSWVTACPRRRYEVEMDGDRVVYATLAPDISTKQHAVTLYRHMGLIRGCLLLDV